MPKPVDLGEEFRESLENEYSIDFGRSTTHETASILKAFRWGPDYLERVNDADTFVVQPELWSGTHGMGLLDSQDYIVYEIDAWGLDHKFPRFTAKERFVPKFRERRALGTDALRLTPAELRNAFDNYRVAWQVKSELLSSTTAIATIQEYQHIIGLGRPVVELIIDALREEVDHWFWALTAIVGKDCAEGAQTMQEAADRWISWYDSLGDETS